MLGHDKAEMALNILQLLNEMSSPDESENLNTLFKEKGTMNDARVYLSHIEKDVFRCLRGRIVAVLDVVSDIVERAE
jgi:hypothetical protein